MSEVVEKMEAPMSTSSDNVKLDSFCEIEASVVTGFESVAAEEVFEKLGVTATPGRGKIQFHVSQQDVTKILHLSSVGNLYVILNHFRDFQFAPTEAESLQQLEALVPDLDWDKGLTVWNKFRDLPSNRIHQQLHPSLSSGQLPSEETSVSRDDNSTSGGLNHNEHSVETVSTDLKDTCEALGSLEIKSTVSVTGEPDVIPSKENMENKSDVARSGDIKYRASCLRTGVGHPFPSPRAAAAFGGRIQDHFGWTVDLENFDLEVVLHVEERHVYVKLALTKCSLHRRNILVFGQATLKPTIAYNMLRLCKIQPGDVVCDPMCGSGTIPIEACLNWPLAHHICGDIMRKNAPKTARNITYVSEQLFHSNSGHLSIDIFRWDCCELPLRDGSVDVFVIDLPFGKRMGSKTQNRYLYPRIVTELARTCRTGTGRACLLTQDKQSMTVAMKCTSVYWTLQRSLHVLFGGLVACVYVLARTAQPFTVAND